MYNEHNPTLRMGGPLELVTGIPYLLGFHPHESLVLIGLARDVLVVTARMDLADAHDTAPVADTIGAMLRGGSTHLLLVIYTEQSHDDGPLPHQSVADTVANAIEEAGATVLDSLLVTGGTWRSYLCTDPRCCPTEGQCVPDAPTPFAAAATVAGLTVAPCRDDLSRRFQPCPGRERLRPLVDQAEQALGPVVVNDQLSLPAQAELCALRAALRAADIGKPRELDDAEVVRLGVALRHIPIRDALWLDIEEHRSGGDVLWLDLARRLPSPYDAAPLFLYGWTTWRQGNSILSRIATERALGSDPAYHAARLLLGAIEHGVNPKDVRPLLAVRRA